MDILRPSMRKRILLAVSQRETLEGRSMKLPLKAGKRTVARGYGEYMDHQYPPVDDAACEVVGLLAYSALAAMTRLAKDGDQAPTIEAHIEHARMSAHAFALFEQLEVWASHRKVELVKAAGEFSGLYDDLDARTRPTTWFERSVKTYVTVGIVGDFLLEVCQRHDLFDGESASWDLTQGKWEREHIAPLTATDPQLAARLSLWARRVAGEVLGLVRATLFTHPELAQDPDTSDAIAAYVTRRHGERMALINLKA